MAVLGRAIAGYLSNLDGLYSVELPESLAHEMHELVTSANSSQPMRALLVSDDTPPAGIDATQWREVLRWRTSDSRIFAWRRGQREPDTSFRSVVRPFISSRFPGAGGGECTLAELVRMCIVEVWARRGRKPVGDSFDAFLEASQWVAGALNHVFELAGSMPSAHWSDRFLEHWAGMLTTLDSNLEAYGEEPLPRHAWEVVRISGLPLPSKIVEGNPFHERPAELMAKEWPKLAELWDDIVQSFIIPEGGRSILLTALDRQVVGVVKTSAWRDLPWHLATVMPLGLPAPVVGRAVFAHETSPTLLTAAIPQFPIAPCPSWWGVTTENLELARRTLRQQTPLVPDDSCSGLIRLVSALGSPYVLNVRSATLSQAHTAKKWRARALVDDVRLTFKEEWSRLHVSPIEPQAAQDGDAWINPDKISFTLRGGKPVSISAARDAADRLVATLAIEVEFSAARDVESGAVKGSSGPARTFHVSLIVRRRGGGHWDSGRIVDAEIELIVPSPHGATVLVTEGGKLLAVAPENQDKFEGNMTSALPWTSEATPTILLKEEGAYDVHVYDGTILPNGLQFAPLVQPAIDSQPMGPPVGAMFPPTRSDLDDGVLIGNSSGVTTADIAVFRVRERSSNLSSGVLSAVRGLPAGRKQPSTLATSGLLGQYQRSIVNAFGHRRGVPLNSLVQYVISSSSESVEWHDHPGLPAPMFLFDIPRGFTLPGIGHGPSDVLARSPTWRSFVEAASEICTALGILPGVKNVWLSGADFSVLTAVSVHKYVDAHRLLVREAKSLGAEDAFWASYPFSVLVVDGRQGANLGQLQAILLSPLHPARLAWTFAVTSVARNAGREDASEAALLQLVEGWNVPCAGGAVNSAGQHRQLVAVPIDPGPEQDFVSWSALAVINGNGLAELPVMAAGLPLPWGGRSGINAKVVERAIKDFLVVHPHLNSLQVDVRSVASAPRAQEIDEALLELVAAENLEEVGQLGGGARVWDSSYRHGIAPTRDRLFAVRGNTERSRPFEWQSYDATNPPVDVDVAFIENASVHLGVVEGVAQGVLGCLPLRRFFPTALVGQRLDQDFLPAEGEDVLGLADLLRELEAPGHLRQPALRATPQAHALGIGRNARWEVLGAFNLDPALLSSVATSVSHSGDRRLLWEWRPSWLPAERRVTDLARRPYYVIARIPSSLFKALQFRQGLSANAAAELLETLGHRGIGLAALNAEGGTQESAAAGFFYSMQILLPPPALTARLPGPDMGGRVLGVIPIDSIESILEGLAGGKLKQRADFLAIAISVRRDGVVQLCFVPVEAKHHGMPSSPEPLPRADDKELGHAREQLSQTAGVLRAAIGLLASPPAKQGVAANYLRRLALATLVDLALNFAPQKPAPVFCGQVLRGILSGQAHVGVGDSILLWFAPGSAQSSGAPCVVDRYGNTVKDGVRVRELFIDPSTVPGLWWSSASAGRNELQVRDLVNTVVQEAFAHCEGSTFQASSDFEATLRELFELPGGHSAGTGSGVEPRVTTQVPDVVAVGPDIGSQSSNYVASETRRPVQGEQALPTSEKGEVPSKPADVAIDPPVVSVAPPPAEEPRAIVGWASPASRWSVLGKLTGSDEKVGLDLDHAKTIGIFGYMGSGKSYLLGNLIESAVEPLPGLNKLQVPLAVVVFNYRRNASDRFELGSLAHGNADPSDTERLSREYGAVPANVRNVHVLCLPGELRPERQREYGKLEATELYFNPRSLGAEDWELLMGEPGSEAVFARTIRNSLIDLRSDGDITLEGLEQQVTTRLTGQSRTAAKLRFDFVRRYISEDRGVNFENLLQAGRILVVDLRQPLFNKDDALRFFLVCANQISKVQGRFNKMLVFDEAHEYMSDAFGDRMEARIRLMRHEGTSYVFATQDVSSIPAGINRFLGTRFVFDLGTRENAQDLEETAPEFRGSRLLGMKPGYCLVQANTSTGGMFSRPREIRVRPRATEHGGGTKIFSSS